MNFKKSNSLNRFEIKNEIKQEPGVDNDEHIDIKLEPKQEAIVKEENIDIKQEFNIKNEVKQEFKEDPLFLLKKDQLNAIIEMIPMDDIKLNLDFKQDLKLARFHVLISLIVANQSKEDAGLKAFTELLKLPLTIDNILAADTDKLEEIIYPINFYKRKIEYIKKISKILKETYDNDIPNNINELCNLPGVGQKIANLVMTKAFNFSVGIAVDSHLTRVANRIGWSKSKKSEILKKELEEWLPCSYWSSINPIMIKFGTQICTTRDPLCNICLCNRICPKNNFQ